MTEKVHEPGETTVQKLMRDLRQGDFPAVSHGWELVEQMIAGLERGGLTLDEIVDAMFYSAAAEVFRRQEDPATAERYIRAVVDIALADLSAQRPTPSRRGVLRHTYRTHQVMERADMRSRPKPTRRALGARRPIPTKEARHV